MEHRLFARVEKSEQLALGDNDTASLNGITLYCNKACLMDSLKIPLLLYTDIETQIALAKLKNAHWYFNYGMVTDYYNVKDQSWPNVLSTADIMDLPKEIKTELVDLFGFKLGDAHIRSQRYNNNEVMKENGIYYVSRLYVILTKCYQQIQQ